MEDLSEIIDKNEMIDFHIYADDQFKTYSYELKQNYKLFNQLIESYGEELAKVLILERRHDLKDFFMKINSLLINYNILFEKINNENIRNYMEIIRKYTKNIRKYTTFYEIMLNSTKI